MSGSDRRRLLVLLHGYEDDPADLADASRLIDPENHFEIWTPRGPLEAGRGFAWFDPSSEHFGSQLALALDELDRRIDQWQEQVADPDALVVVGGFSQGGAVALAHALRRRATDQGAPTRSQAFCLGGFLAPPDQVDYDFESAANRQVLLVHGRSDETVPIDHARSAARILQRHGATVSLVEVDSGHALDIRLLEPVRDWLATL